MRLAKASPARSALGSLPCWSKPQRCSPTNTGRGLPCFVSSYSRRSPSNGWIWASASARLLLEEGKAIDDARFPRSAFSIDDFLMQLARLDPDQALERLRKLPTAILLGDPYDPGAAVAVALATDHPAKAEQAFHLWKRNWVHSDHTNRYVMHLCRRLAQVDPAIARRVAASRQPGGARDGLGLRGARPGGNQKVRRVEAIDNAIQEIDRLRESGPGPEQVMILQGIRGVADQPRRRDPARGRTQARNGSPKSSGAAAALIPGSIRPRRNSSVFRTSDLSACCWRGTIATWLPSSTSRWMLTSARLRLAKARRRNSM